MSVKEKSSTERIACKDLREGEHFSRVRLRHMREADEGLCVSYGYRYITAAPKGATCIYATEKTLFAYNPTSRTMENTGKRLQITGIPRPTFLYDFVNYDGETGVYFGGESRVTFWTGEQKVHYGYSLRAVHGAIHRDRLFVVGNYRLSYSPAYKCGYFTNSDQDVEGAGYIEFLPTDGELVGVASFRDKLYVFAQRGLLRVRADGEALNFKVEKMPYYCGELIRGTLQVCGEYLAFFTNRGFFLYDGNEFRHVTDGALSEIDYSAEKTWESAFFDGSYFVLVTLKDGTAGILMYDFLFRRFSFLSGEQLSIAAGDKLYFEMPQETLYEFTPRGMPIKGKCGLELTVPLRKRAALEGVTFYGSGECTLTAEAGGKTYTYPCKAGSRVGFPVALREREVALSLAVSSEAFVLSSLELDWRNYDD